MNWRARSSPSNFPPYGEFNFSDMLRESRLVSIGIFTTIAFLIAGFLSCLPNEARGASDHLPILDVRNFGARGDGRSDDTAAIQATLNAAGGNEVYVPAGKYRISSPITSTIPIHIQGAGMGAGAVPADISTVNCTVFLAGSGTEDVFRIRTNYPSVFRDFLILADLKARPCTAGAGIHLIYGGGTGHASNSVVDHVAFSNLYEGIRVEKPENIRIRDCYFVSWAHAGIEFTTTKGVESAPGWIENNRFCGNGTDGKHATGVPVKGGNVTQGPAIISQSGYINISRNAIIGAQVGISLAIANNPAGAPRIYQNWIENQSVAGIEVASTDGSKAGMLAIEQNEFSNVDGASPALGHIVIYSSPNAASPWLSNVSIRGNVFHSRLPSSSRYIWVQAGSYVDISNNQINDIAHANPIGIEIGVADQAGLGAPVDVFDNQIVGTTAEYKFDSSVKPVIRDMNGLSYAWLPADCGNGSQVYVTDGRALSSSDSLLTGSGSGTVAYMQNGKWRCLPGN